MRSLYFDHTLDHTHCVLKTLSLGWPVYVITKINRSSLRLFVEPIKSGYRWRRAGRALRPTMIRDLCIQRRPLNGSTDNGSTRLLVEYFACPILQCDLNKISRINVHSAGSLVQFSPDKTAEPLSGLLCLYYLRSGLQSVRQQLQR